MNIISNSIKYTVAVRERQKLDLLRLLKRNKIRLRLVAVSPSPEGKRRQTRLRAFPLIGNTTRMLIARYDFLLVFYVEPLSSNKLSTTTTISRTTPQNIQQVRTLKTWQCPHLLLQTRAAASPAVQQSVDISYQPDS